MATMGTSSSSSLLNSRDGYPLRMFSPAGPDRVHPSRILIYYCVAALVRSKVRAFEGTVYRNIAVFGKSSLEEK
eukprot:gene3640-21135_t